MERQPKRFVGASVRNVDEIYKRIKPLFREISSCSRCEERRSASKGTPKAYCVTVDVERCFDTIRPRKLYQVLKKAIQEDEYLIRKHWVGHQVAPISDSDESLPSSSFFFKLERPAYPSGELLGFEELAAQSKKENAMFVDGVLYDYLTKAKALELLKEHLSTNVVQVDGRDYVQRCGIPQGSVLSTTLCNMYYAHFERRVLGKRLPELYVNYEKLSSSLLQASIPFNETKAAQEFFVTKVVSAIRQRWHALYFDPELLSEDTIRVNLFQMQIVAAHRFTILIEMLPFVNRDMHFFHECIHRILKKMTKGIHRSLELAAQPSSGLSLSSYHAQKHQVRKYSNLSTYILPLTCLFVPLVQVWTIGLRAFQLMIQAKRDQAKTSNAQRKQQCNWVDWQKLLDAIQSEQKEFKQQEKKTRSTGPAFDFAWLMSDRRNASMLKRCLGVGSVDRS
uniref:Telomerase reverse transcriptase n=1 Tax=Phytophthora ramorum TaxID=164328 RepID=H3H6H1_PHYRM